MIANYSHDYNFALHNPQNGSTGFTYNQPVLLPPNKEATSLGAWVSAAVELGFYASHSEALKNAQGDQTHTVFNPIKEHTQIYDQLMSRLKLLYDLFI